MYLVLTAMLALNVSTDILNGFTMVDNSLHSSIAASNSRNERLYQDFQVALEKNQAKTQGWYNKAQEVKEKADSLYNYLQEFKYDLASMADGRGRVNGMMEKGEDPTLHILNNSNVDVTGTYALVGGHGQELKNNVGAYCDYITSLINAKDSALIKTLRQTLATDKAFNAHDGVFVDWEIAVFDGMPIGASMAVLSKMQNDIRTTEGQIVQYLMDQTDAGDLRVNKTQAYIIPKSTSVFLGDKYSAQIIVAAEDTTQKPQLFVNGVQIGNNSLYEVQATREGLQKYDGFISITNPNTDEVTQLPFSGEYMVSKPAVIISHKELNVMFSDYDNAFSVSVPGLTSDKLRLTATEATVRKSGNDWIINPKKSAKEISVTVTMDMNGKSQSMTQKFRVKPIPNPNAYFSVGEREYASGDKVAKSNLKKESGRIVVSYGPEGLLNVPFTVKSFIPIIDGNVGSIVNGDRFTKNQLNEIQNLKLGKLVILQDIRAIGPGGQEKRLSPLILTVN